MKSILKLIMSLCFGVRIWTQADLDPSTTKVSLYELILRTFREGIANLTPLQAYVSLQSIALDLAFGRFSEINATIGFSAIRSRRHLSRSETQLSELSNAYSAYQRGDLFELKRCVAKITDSNTSDPRLSIDAQHLLGRALFNNDDVTQAEQIFLLVLAQAQCIEYEDGFIRALHEISRVKAETKPVEAEAGFRVALDYYACRALKLDAKPELMSGDTYDAKNTQAALNCLKQLADTYALLSRGPTEAVRVIDDLNSTFVRSSDDSGYDFLEIRGLALVVLTRKALSFHTANLIGKVLKLYDRHRLLALSAIDEATWICSQRGLSYPGKLKVILSQTEPFPLRTHPHFKPIILAEESNHSIRHCSPEDAAESIEDLYNYLARLDHQGRYVYRGQVKEYEGPLIPSSFRPIFRKPHPVRVITHAAGGDRKRLRNCGEIFVGEYNDCFRYYADVMQQFREVGENPQELERIFRVYKRLLDDPGMALQQDSPKFMPWSQALQQVLSPAELETYYRNATEWDLRINNYHKRLFREQVLFRLFGYALGTTFAQQYGLSSEGLDATRSIGVACFFATHESPDFEKVAERGLGVVYRFPFPVNEIASQRLSEINYYNLPSVVDVEDVFYRFERNTLERHESIELVLCYLSSVFAYDLDSSDLLFLPNDFLRSSRVHMQESVMLIPDEIREDEPNRTPGFGGVIFPKYRYIEDIGSRPGVVRFYFKHEGIWPERLKLLRRERLWPRDDFLLETLILLIASSYRLTEALPKRLDLIDGGYSQVEFLSFCQSLYEKHRHQFFTTSEQVARRSGTLIL